MITTALRTLALTAFTTVISTAAFAAEEAAHGGEHGGGGLPQFDPSTFASQAFWLVLMFVTLYAVFGGRILPALTDIVESRQNKIQGNLDLAEKMKSEAQVAQTNYESLLSSARVESTRLLSEADQSSKSKTDQKLKAVGEKTARDIEAMDARLETEKARAKKQMSGIAAEIASEAAARIVGIKTDLQQAQNVVDNLNKKEAA